MAKRLGRWTVMAVAVLAAGCGGGGSDEPEVFPDQTLEITGVRAPVDGPADVLYGGGNRWIRIYDTGGAYVELAFAGEGDPSVPAFELPDDGKWLGFDDEFVGLSVCEPLDPVHYDCRDYQLGDAIVGEMDLVGDIVHGTISFGGGFRVSGGGNSDEVLWSYTGLYDYKADE